MNLTINQQNAINEINHNLQIIACAGSGKTEVITRRIANILYSSNTVTPKNIVAFTFTEKAAESMKNRIKKRIEEQDCSDSIEEMYVGTIHSFCFTLLKQKCPEFLDFKILDSVKNYLFIKRYYKECGMEDLDLSLASFNIKLFMECIDKLIDDIDNFEIWEEKNQKVFLKYKEFLYSKRYFSFSFLIYEAIQQIKLHPDIISKIKFLVVDEYQDINDMQEKLIQQFYNNGSNICVVGDDDQTIYRI